MPEKCAFYSVRNDTARLSGGCTDVLLTRRGRERGGGSMCEATPANTGDGFISRYYNRHRSRGYSPIARNSTRMARPSLPLAPSPSNTDRVAFAAGRHFQKPSLHMRFILLQEGCSRPAVSCYTPICSARTRTEEGENTTTGPNFNLSSISLFKFFFSFFYAKVRHFLIIF